MTRLDRKSVIMPVERIGGDAERAIASVLEQEPPFPFELIVVSAEPLDAARRDPRTERRRAES